MSFCSLQFFWKAKFWKRGKRLLFPYFSLLFNHFSFNECRVLAFNWPYWSDFSKNCCAKCDVFYIKETECSFKLPKNLLHFSVLLNSNYTGGRYTYPFNNSESIWKFILGVGCWVECIKLLQILSNALLICTNFMRWN